MKFFIVKADYEVEGHNEHFPQTHRGTNEFYVLARNKQSAIQKVKKEFDNSNYRYSNYQVEENRLIQ